MDERKQLAFYQKIKNLYEDIGVELSDAQCGANDFDTFKNNVNKLISETLPTNSDIYLQFEKDFGSQPTSTKKTRWQGVLWCIEMFRNLIPEEK